MTHTQLMGIGWALDYIANVVYHCIMVGSEEPTEGLDEVANQRFERQETQEAGMGTSEVPSGEIGEAQEVGSEGTED